MPIQESKPLEKSTNKSQAKSCSKENNLSTKGNRQKIMASITFFGIYSTFQVLAEGHFWFNLFQADNLASFTIYS